jgi:hypothetical protein
MTAQTTQSVCHTKTWQRRGMHTHHACCLRTLVSVTRQMRTTRAHCNCSLQPTLPNESQQSRTRVLHASQLQEQNRLVTSNQRTLQQTMDPNSRKTHPGGPGTGPRETIRRRWLKPVLHHPWRTLVWEVWLTRNEDLMAATKMQKNARDWKSHAQEESSPCAPSRTCFC